MPLCIGLGQEIEKNAVGVGFKDEFFEFFEWILNWMKQIFIFAIQKIFALIHYIQSYFGSIQQFIEYYRS